jgi:hypothetical protein
MDRLENFFLANGLLAKTHGNSIVGIGCKNPDAELEYHISDGKPTYISISQVEESAIYSYSD